ncbi:hypothetical protein AB0I72_19320 [Nocardiopsis sp. NPDC049922]|uniref:hypothetical protein n=1 Tax=Nocardiopsis sp. NPDC049922 TaxID=3155157 RepID=UPI0033E4D989
MNTDPYLAPGARISEPAPEPPPPPPGPAGASQPHSDGPTLTVVEGLVIRPGDTLIVRVANSEEPKAARQFARDLKKNLPGVKILVVGAEQLAVYRASEQPEEAAAS